MKVVKTTEDLFCPRCGNKLESILSKQVKISKVATKPIYACPKCKTILPGPVSL